MMTLALYMTGSEERLSVRDQNLRCYLQFLKTPWPTRVRMGTSTTGN